jgi:hypothetical protein
MWRIEATPLEPLLVEGGKERPHPFMALLRCQQWDFSPSELEQWRLPATVMRHV